MFGSSSIIPVNAGLPMLSLTIQLLLRNTVLFSLQSSLVSIFFISVSGQGKSSRSLSVRCSMISSCSDCENCVELKTLSQGKTLIQHISHTEKRTCQLPSIKQSKSE